MSSEQKQTEAKNQLPTEDVGFLAQMLKIGVPEGSAVRGLAVAFSRVKLSAGQTVERTSIRFDATDVIAFFSGLVAIIFAIGMLPGWIPINKLTIGVVSFAAVAPALAHVAKAMSNSNKKGKSKRADRG